MLTLQNLAGLLLVLFVSLAKSNLEYDGWVNINLQHSLTGTDEVVLTQRGNITVQSLRTGTNVLRQGPLMLDDRKKIRELALQNKFYQLRAEVQPSDGPAYSFLSTVKACMLVEAELNDILSISLDYAGRVVAVTMTVASTSTCEGADVPLEKLKEFSTSIFVRHTEVGPTPDTASYIQKLEREREAKERGEVKDNRSFLAKYWMYIVPVVIIMVLSSAANPEGQGVGGGNSGGR